MPTPTPNWGRLPPDSEAARKALASIGESDIAKLESFFETIKTSGAAPKAGGGVTEITASQARALFKVKGLFYDKGNVCYIRNGKQIAPQVVKAASQAALNQSAADIGVLATRATSGTAGVAELLTGIPDALKRSLMSSTSLAHGGIDNVPQSAWNRAEERLLELIAGRNKTDTQRGFKGIREVLELVQKGKFDNDLDTLGNVLTSFTNAARTTYENEISEATRDAGLNEVCRILAGAVNHCPDCLEIAAMGWRENDGSYPIGGDFCQNFCYCIEIFRRAGGKDVEAVTKSIESAQAKLAAKQQLDAQRMKDE